MKITAIILLWIFIKKSCIQSNFPELAGLIKFTRPFLSSVSKAKAAKLVRALVDLFLDMEAGTGKEVREHGSGLLFRFNSFKGKYMYG